MNLFRIKQYGSIPPPYGGVSVFVKRLFLALNKNGWKSGAFHSGYVEGCPKELLKYLDRFPYHTRSLFVLPELVKLLRIFQNYDLIHSHLSLSSCFSTWLIHKILRIPVVYTIHNQMIDVELKNMNFIDWYCLKSLASDSNVQFVSVNANIEKALSLRGITFHKPIMVLPAYIPPVETGNISDYLPASLEDYITIDTPFILFYAESLSRYNDEEIYGLNTAVKSFAILKEQFPNLRIVLCVTNVNNPEDISTYKKELEIFSESVYWQIGPLPEMWPLMKFATLLLRPTCTDGDSIMIREALSYGLPVVTSDVVCRPEGTILYKYGDIRDLIDKTTKVLSNPQRKVYAQADNTDVMLQIYRDLLLPNNKY